LCGERDVGPTYGFTASPEVGSGATIGTLQTGYLHVQALSQNKVQGMRPHTGKKEAGGTAAVGGTAGLHGGRVTGDRPKWCFGALKLIVRSQGGVGEDGEAGGDVGEALEGRR
jgi:hypothetical protein